MKRFVQVLAMIFVLSSFISMMAAFGMQRLPDRAAPKLPVSRSAPQVLELAAVVTPEPGIASRGLSLLERLLSSPRLKRAPETEPAADQETEMPSEPPEPEIMPTPEVSDAPLDGEEESIEDSIKPDSLDQTPSTTYLLPDFGDLPVLVNRDNILPREFVPELAAVPGTYFQLEPETLEGYKLLMAAAKEAGHNKLRLQSAYRSYDTQVTLHERKVSKLKPQYGDEARARAAQIVARPGESEHQLGQAVDIANGSLVQSFGDTPAGIWMAENVHKYGFILRYPKDKTDITGILYEPWHFRYVGVEIATVIYENGWTLEEFFDNL